MVESQKIKEISKMAKEISVQSSRMSAHFNQMREEVLNRYLRSYANRIRKRRKDTIVRENDCCDRGKLNNIGWLSGCPMEGCL